MKWSAGGRGQGRYTGRHGGRPGLALVSDAELYWTSSVVSPRRNVDRPARAAFALGSEFEKSDARQRASSTRESATMSNEEMKGAISAWRPEQQSIATACLFSVVESQQPFHS